MKVPTFPSQSGGTFLLSTNETAQILKAGGAKVASGEKREPKQLGAQKLGTVAENPQFLIAAPRIKADFMKQENESVNPAMEAYKEYLERRRSDESVTTEQTSSAAFSIESLLNSGGNNSKTAESSSASAVRSSLLFPSFALTPQDGGPLLPPLPASAASAGIPPPEPLLSQMLLSLSQRHHSQMLAATAAMAAAAAVAATNNHHQQQSNGVLGGKLPLGMGVHGESGVKTELGARDFLSQSHDEPDTTIDPGKGLKTVLKLGSGVNSCVSEEIQKENWGEENQQPHKPR